MIQQGSLVIDVFSKGQVVWRGAGEAEIKPEYSQERRAELIREAVRDIIRRYPQNKNK